MRIPGHVLSFVLSTLLAGTLCAQDNPPDSFDLRGWWPACHVTSVKSQQGGTCWTHGAMAAMESNLLITGNWAAAGDTGEPNLAEYHLDWWNGFNQHNNDDIDPPTGEGMVVHEGGDYKVAAAYLMRGEGAVRDIDGQSFDDPPLRYDTGFHIYYPRHIEFYSARADLSNINTVKWQLMEYGALGTCMSMNFEDFMDFQEWTYYQPDSAPDQPVHAIAIIGWDNNKVTQAPQPGAWLCKNSWGTGWGQGGYFWISFYDRWCAKHSSMGAVSFQDVELQPWSRIYCHDYHGWRDTYEDYHDAFNAFTSLGLDLLEAVSFCTAVDSVDYAVTVYDSFEGGSLGDSLTGTSGHIAYKGYHSVNLEKSLALSPDEDFYVRLQLSRGGQPYDCTSQIDLLLGANYRVVVPSTSDWGQSFYWENDQWNDVKGINLTANFCIKALCREEAVSMNPQPAIGFVPLEVYFDAASELEVDSWHWQFGDGGMADGQDPTHTYSERACYDVIASLEVDGDTLTFTQPFCVIALADTLDAPDAEAAPGFRAEVAVRLTNTIPLDRIQVPVEYSGTIDYLALDSMSTLGCRTESFNQAGFCHWDPFNKRYALRLEAGSAPELEPDSGTIVRLFFTIPADAAIGQSAQLTFEGYEGHPPMCEGSLGWYEAAADICTVSVVADCCSGERGNVDADHMQLVNIVDLTHLVQYLFDGGAPSLCMDEADVQADGNVNIIDLTYLAAYLFGEGSPPHQCP